ncbi:MAG: hypothetical protein ACK4SF_15750 [Algoriphagus aquaeductus]|uniref:hypothetical protein n=1 Tax=Algoriphagus aquaeductus TaxID=475299 RepID=UPI00391BADE5
MRFRKSWLFLSLLLLPLLLFAGLFFYINQNQGVLVTRALQAFNQKIYGEIQIDSSEPALFENFPYISIDLRGVRLYEDKSEGTPIAQVDDFYLGFNLWNLLQSDYTVKKNQSLRWLSSCSQRFRPKPQCDESFGKRN